MSLPGFELLYNSIQPQLRSPQDAIVASIHWFLVSSGFKLTGVGETPTGEGLCTEDLPPEWNQQEVYILRYISAAEPKKAYLLKVLPVDATLLAYFQLENNENVATVELSVEEHTTQDLSSVHTCFRNMEKLNSSLKSLLNGAADSQPEAQDGREAGNKPSSSTGAHGGKDKKKDKKKSPLLIEDHSSPGYMPHRPMQPAWGESGGFGGRPMNPFSVGGSDLDPMSGLGGPGRMGGGGGGMIMDPRHMPGGPGGGRFGPGPGRGGGIHPGSLPPGAVPPGARFDPFGPGGMRPGPDPDHERPPDYDDMFM